MSNPRKQPARSPVPLVLAAAAVLASLAAGPGSARAQAPVVGAIEDTLLFTVGTTTVGADGRPWAYLLWRAAAGADLAERQFAVYRKAGDPGSAAPFEPQGVVAGALSPKIVTVLLQRAERLGHDPGHAAFDATLAAFEANLGLESTGDRAVRTAAMLQAARSRAGMSGSIHALAAASPELALCLGIAWAGPMPGGRSTYELREWDPVACVDVGVAGRITLDAGVVVPLPAPGTPVQVPDASNSGDRSISLRWATPDDLRRRALLAHGFTLWRLPWSDAVARGWDATAPTPGELRTAAGQGAVRRLNALPLFPDRTLDAAQATDFAADPDTFFFVDNNGRFESPPGTPHPDGSAFAYLATARDLLGRDGVPSRAGHGLACRTVAPPSPEELSAAVIFDAPTLPGRQIIRLSWAPDNDPELPPATRYEVFRGTDQADLNSPGPDPASLLAVVARPPGPGPIVFDDLTFHQNGRSEEEFHGRTFWYAVRGIHEGACSALASPPCPPVFATLSDHRPPPAPAGGAVIGSCPQPVVIHDASAGFPIADDPAPPGGDHHFRLICRRRDPGIEWAEFAVETGLGEIDLGRFHFGGDSDEVEAEATLSSAEIALVAPLPRWRCRVGGSDGQASVVAEVAFRPPAPDPSRRNVVPFLGGTLSPATIDLSDPLAAPLLTPGAVLAGADAPARDGWVVATGLEPGGEYVVMRESTIETVTVDWGIADSGGVLVFLDAGLGASTPSEVGASYRAWRFVRHSPCPADPPHQALNPVTGALRPIRLCLPRHPDALEYRLFRRVDSGPLTLFAQDRVAPSPGPICRSDDALVSHGACITYFAQFIGRNGASSAMSVLGCRTICVPPPVPVLAPPQPVGDPANPRIELRWSCPPLGVDRFEVFLIPQGGATVPPHHVAGASTFLRSVSLLREASPTASPTSVFMKFSEASGVAKYLALQEKLLTPRVGTGGIGEGPEFSLTIPVALGREYRVSVRALSTGGACSGNQSLQYAFKWTPPPQVPDRSVPWPARPLPGATPDPAGGIAAFPLHDFGGFSVAFETMFPGQKHRAAAGVRIGRMPAAFDANLDDDGSFQFYPGAARSDPNAYLFARPGVPGRPCLPGVLYRQQVANATWPVVSGEVVQVSPLVRRLAWRSDPGGFSSFLTDPFAAVQRVDIRGFGEILQPAFYDLFLLDTTPVVRGATYRYWLVCFTGHDEPEVVVTSDPISIPLAP